MTESDCLTAFERGLFLACKARQDGEKNWMRHRPCTYLSLWMSHKIMAHYLMQARAIICTQAIKAVLLNPDGTVLFYGFGLSVPMSSAKIMACNWLIIFRMEREMPLSSQLQHFHTDAKMLQKIGRFLLCVRIVCSRACIGQRNSSRHNFSIKILSDL